MWVIFCIAANALHSERWSDTKCDSYDVVRQAGPIVIIALRLYIAICSHPAIAAHATICTNNMPIVQLLGYIGPIDEYSLPVLPDGPSIYTKRE